MKNYRHRTGIKGISAFAASLLLSAALLFPAAVVAEGISADMTMTLGRSVLNIGKTFSVTVAVKPNANINITSFDFILGFDSSKVDLIRTDGSPKIGRPSNVPSTFKLESNLDGNNLIVLGSDETTTQSAPIKASLSTPLIIFYFKVRDSAPVGSTTSFTISEPTINQQVSGGDPVAISLNIKSPKTGTIGAKLDTNNYLSSLTADTGVLSPAFEKTTGEYRIDVPEDCDLVNFAAAAVSAKATLKISGGEGLDYGPNTVTIKITAEDPDYVRTYTITVNRANPPTPTPIATPTEEPSEDISSDPGISSEAASSSISTESVANGDTPADGGIWKNLTILFASLFLVTAAATLWLTIDKVRNRDKIIKVKRV
ncbi:MAG: cadherin-like beta sandwich domain-containing protein [Saccharofermentanales bacterium]